ncbi:hypothetical protein COX11_02335 [Candidatus Berkelbacteria bacterium CG23_combo_of_CG06-09_8_20_14_all_41_73]|uniref:Uncharacterized protein n=1 Tax=Candidatus Berkelbacteria bacterium CG23_combo_of_CG06-09_8_20_14_all_41_73 TaxID=1974519 RepID=A0A2H0AZC9_9BACT|nr:MAG: hypothetical protein COX11_02335 [Candidatus Berkelbacteria bacterium CG23_combo_of_CG06-09_8_20_14_all_41_73]
MDKADIAEIYDALEALKKAGFYVPWSAKGIMALTVCPTCRQGASVQIHHRQAGCRCTICKRRMTISELLVGLGVAHKQRQELPEQSSGHEFRASEAQTIFNIGRGSPDDVHRVRWGDRSRKPEKTLRKGRRLLG